MPHSARTSLSHTSWGNVIRAEHQVVSPDQPYAAARVLTEIPAGRPAIAYGCGRSYGDVALNPGGLLIETRRLDCFISFDAEKGLLTCESGVTLAEILRATSVPAKDGSGWLLPVVPGTRFVTVGGAIANDVHGKNAHVFGSFGCHVESLDLARSDGRILTCSAQNNAELFAATVGGLGLTGLILRATLRLRRVEGLALETEEIRFARLADFFALDAESAVGWEYTAAWIDCLARGNQLGRGIYLRARHAPGVSAPPPSLGPRRSVPIAPPLSLVNGLSVRAFNAAYWRKLGTAERVRRVVPYEGAFFPLDALGGWNRLYGPKGFFQFQCVVPPEGAEAATAELLAAIAEAGQGSMLVVLKRFGHVVSPGLLSFPMPGITLALDFPNAGADTVRLMTRLEAIAVAAGGRLYPAKDALMTAESFARGYPRLDRFRGHMDPALSSAFSRRVGLSDASDGSGEGR
ncbi:FAD-binding oxidoreductase [Aquabacter sp. L1I39]|uniref:FAD-binding oxidoreductase n=1 Tax=Aquabacter sp. L1I39 TaxID=2820278 RepID=UPI001AD9744C|nr:FAD-binding oxidoreductase [Aquabacter sp. L1I39]QTL05354.1 FAD-binding oxidoreductase [Aquabacter sp. L1I39]